MAAKDRTRPYVSGLCGITGLHWRCPGTDCHCPVCDHDHRHTTWVSGGGAPLTAPAGPTTRPQPDAA